MRSDLGYQCKQSTWFLLSSTRAVIAVCSRTICFNSFDCVGEGHIIVVRIFTPYGYIPCIYYRCAHTDTETNAM